jgi:hypothetical protein
MRDRLNKIDDWFFSTRFGALVQKHLQVFFIGALFGAVYMTIIIYLLFKDYITLYWV